MTTNLNAQIHQVATEFNYILYKIAYTHEKILVDQFCIKKPEPLELTFYILCTSFFFL